MTYRAIAVCAFLFMTISIPSGRADTPMQIDVRLGQAVMQSDLAQRNYLRIALKGCTREKTDRTPVNVGFVIDRSGSMQGLRMTQAREAAIAALRRLDDRDIASVVIFDDTADVLVPAQKVADHAAFIDRIERVDARGRTAIHAGVENGASEVRKFKDNRRLNRIVLLSDGRANVGPSKAEDFARLGRELLAEGISVSTIGLGLDYNEDLMLQLARASDGNHTFAGTGADLIQIFNREFDDALASCAQTVSIDVEFAPGIRAVRALSRDGAITGQNAQFKLNQVYQTAEHYVLLEVEVDPRQAGGEQSLGRVHVAYTAPQDGSQRTLDAGITGRFSASDKDASASRDDTVLAAVVEQTTRERTVKAIALRDQGKIEEARALLQQNAAEIEAYQVRAAAPSARLQQLQQEYGAIAKASAAAFPAQWNAQRKMLRQMDRAPAGSGVRY